VSASMARPARSQGSDGAPRSSTGHDAATHTRAPTPTAQAQAAARAARARRDGGSARTRMLGSVLSAPGTQNLQRNAVVFLRAQAEGSLSRRCCTGRSRPAKRASSTSSTRGGVPSRFGASNRGRKDSARDMKVSLSRTDSTCPAQRDR
jgi:hypothetical protein